MNKKPVAVTPSELADILDKYFDAGSSLNYAVKIVGHPGVGKSAIVRQAAEKKNLHFIDTRLAFKENVDLGGYPVPDHAAKSMIYYRPRFIPPEKVPENRNGIVWFLDEANRAHPTVIQTLFQIITERICGEHVLPDRTSIVLAGNLGVDDNTTIADFDDSALDGRLAIFQLKPAAQEWIAWAGRAGLHPSILRYITLFPDRLWDEAHINPNPRGWHQVSLAITESYGIATEDRLAGYFAGDPGGTLTAVIHSLVGAMAGTDFITQLTAPRAISTDDMLSGSEAALSAMTGGTIPSEDLLWALSGAVGFLCAASSRRRGDLDRDDLAVLANVLQFIGFARGDVRLSFFYLLIRDCGIFTQVPAAIKLIPDKRRRAELMERFTSIIGMEDE